MAVYTVLHSNCVKMLDNQEQTDVFFVVVDPHPELVCAHKVILSAASPIFKALLSHNWCNNEEAIAIKDCEINIFKLFLRIIYMNNLPVEIKDPETLTDLYKLSHMYQTHNTTDLLSKRMIRDCNDQNVIQFANTTWTYDDVQLKQFCERLFAKHTMAVLASEELFFAHPSVLFAIFSLHAMNLDYENTLVRILDDYIIINQKRIPDILVSLKPAIESIRLLKVDNNVIIQCKNLDFRNLLAQRWKKLSDLLEIGAVDPIMVQRREKVTLLNYLPIEMLQQLFRCFGSDSSERHLILRGCNQNSKYYAQLIAICKKYRHFKLNEYYDDDIKKILVILKQIGLDGNENFKIFENYEGYLDPREATLKRNIERPEMDLKLLFWTLSASVVLLSLGFCLGRK